MSCGGESVEGRILYPSRLKLLLYPVFPRFPEEFSLCFAQLGMSPSVVAPALAVKATYRSILTVFSPEFSAIAWRLAERLPTSRWSGW